MEEQRVSFKTAKLAKEKGFNIITEQFYCENYEGICEEHEEFLISDSLEDGIYDCNNEFNEGERWNAPTQSLLQKWLMEVYTINVFVEYTKGINGTHPLTYSYRSVIILQDGTRKFLSSFDIFEEGLEVGLTESLKLI